MKARQQGFTLIELVVVIIILGVLSAVAVPKFTDMSVQARNAAAKGVAGSIAAATSINYAAKQTGAATAVTLNQANVCNGTTLAPLIDGVKLVAAAPANDKEFRIVASTTAGVNRNCNAATNATTATCGVLAYGTGAVAQDVSIICAR